MKQSLAILATLGQLEKHATSKTMKDKIIPHYKRMAALVGAFESTVNQQMASDTPAKHVERVIQNGNALSGKIKTIGTHALNLIGETTYKLRNDALNKAGLSKEYDQSNAAEIRSVIREMPNSEKVKLISQKNPEIIRALVDSNQLLHGVPQASLDGIIDSMLESTAPGTMSEINELEEFMQLESKLSGMAQQGIKSVTESEHVAEVLAKAKIAGDIHNDFVNKLNEV